jgi:hypothetical protein
MQLKIAHNLSLIENNIKITSTVTCFGPTWPSSGNCPLFELENTAFRKLDLFSSSGDGGLLERANLNYVQWLMLAQKNPVILSIIHHRQNPLEL